MFFFLSLFLMSEGSFEKIDLGDRFLLSVLKVQEAEGVFYMLDWRSRSVIGFDENGFIKQIGTGGNGPMELKNPSSFAVDEGTFYILDDGGIVKIYNADGIFQRQVRLNISTKEAFSIQDILIVKGHLIASFDAGEFSAISFYDSGEPKTKWEMPLAEYPSTLGRAFELKSTQGKVYVFSRFDGSLFELEPHGKAKKVGQAVIPLHQQRMERSIKSAKEEEKKAVSQTTTVILFNNLFETEHGLLAILRKPSEEAPNLLHSYHFSGETSKKAEMFKKPETENKLRGLWRFGEQTLLLDREGTVYIKSRR